MAESTTATEATEATEEFELEVWDSLPQGAPRESKLVKRIEKVKELEHGKPILFARKPSATAATGTANHLKMRWGVDPSGYGFKFKTRKLDSGEYGVFVIYDPSKIVPGEAEKVDAKYNAHRAKVAESQRQRNAAKAAEGNGKGGKVSKATVTK